MKKIIRVLFFAFALVLFTGTVNAAPRYKVTVNYYDSLSGKSLKMNPAVYYSNSIDNKETLLYRGLNLSSNSATLYQVPNTKDYYFFQGWVTEDGEEIGITAENATEIDGVKFYSISASKLAEIHVDVTELTENKVINIYSKWSEKVHTAKVNVHIYDNKAYSENSVYDRTNMSNLSIYGATGPIYFDLHQMFLNDDTTSYLRYTDETGIVKLNGSATYYKFVKYVDADGNELKEGYSNQFVESVSLLDVHEVSPNTYTNSLAITFKSAQDAKLTEDVDFNVYVVWEEFTTAILEHEYIDEVSTGSGSWKNVTGGTTSYTHTFNNPEDGTAMEHYDFLYWQHEESDDDQVDSTKEYKAGDEFTYNLSNKESGWTGKVTTYAWWQPDVTLNLYSDGKLLSSESSFTSVSVTEPSKYGYKFLGWFDGNGNKVTATTFYAAEKGINPEVREYTLYAKWERIMTDVKVSLVWDDNNNEDGVRPASVKVELKDGEEVVETITLSEENNWTYTFNVPKYGEESEIEYTVSQEEVEYYVTTTTGSVEEGFVLNNFHEVWPKGQGGDDFEVVQTGNEINYSLLLIGLFVELLFVKRKLFN